MLFFLVVIRSVVLDDSFTYLFPLVIITVYGKVTFVITQSFLGLSISLLSMSSLMHSFWLMCWLFASYIYGRATG